MGRYLRGIKSEVDEHNFTSKLLKWMEELDKHFTGNREVTILILTCGRKCNADINRRFSREHQLHGLCQAERSTVREGGLGAHGLTYELHGTRSLGSSVYSLGHQKRKKKKKETAQLFVSPNSC